MTKVLFIGMLPPDSHNPEEQRFVEELSRHLDEVRYLRGIGIKGFGVRQLRSLIGPRISRTERPFRRLFVAPPRRLWHPLNVAWLRRQLLAVTEARPYDFLLWTRFPSPELVEAIEEVPFRSIIYEPIDRYDASLDFTPGERRRLAAAESRIAKRAAVIAGSASVAHRFVNAAGGSRWLPFGRDCRAISDNEGAVASGGRLRIGTVAEFDWRVDERRIWTIAHERPQWQIVLVGPRRKNWGKSLEHLRNVEFVGRVAPAQIPGIVRSFDVGLIPYIENDWTRACLPVKLYDYLAEGRPVVSAHLPELAPFSDVIELVSSNEFVSAIVRALADDTPTKRRRRIEASTRFTLQHRVSRVVSLIQDQPWSVAR
jgi:hypothetical protein